jgi:hypothetical protein
MGRKPKKPAAEEEPKKATAVVRIEADLARMLNIISTATSVDVSDILSPQVRAYVEKRYAEVIQLLGKEIKGKE